MGKRNLITQGTVTNPFPIKLKTMYRQNTIKSTGFNKNTSYIGETIEQKINRIVNNKEPIKDGAPIVYTDRKDGVQPQYDIRTDKWEVALDAMDVVSKTNLTKREMSIGERTYDTMNDTQKGEFHKKFPHNKYKSDWDKQQKSNSGAEPAQGTTAE